MDSDEQSRSQTTPGLEDVSSLKRLPLHSTDLLTLLDPSGVVLYESPSIERLYGYDQEELVGKQVAEYFHPEDRERVLAAFEAIVESDEHRVEAVEYRHLMADGTYRWIESVASTNTTPEGHYVVNSRDISERKERERDLEHAREQIQSERDGKEAIRRLLLASSTDEEIADRVCRLLVDTYGYEAAWVVRDHQRESDGGPSPLLVSTHGHDSGFRAKGGPVDGVTARALATSDPVVVTRDTAGDSALADRLADCGLNSVRSVPLEHEGITYGALTVVQRDLGGGFVAELVGEMADALAFKQRIHRQQAALAAETVIELQIGIADGHVLAALSSTDALPATASLSAEELRTTADEWTLLVRTSAVDGETLRTAASGLPAVTETTVVTETEATAVVRIRVETLSFGEVLSGYGGVVQSITARDGRVTLTVQLPRRTRVGAVVETVREQWPDATIHARNDRPIDQERPAAFEGLTRKQEDALRAATLTGFFERPQEASAEEVAATLDVSASTFLHHVRNAEAKVFSEVFAPHRDAE